MTAYTSTPAAITTGPAAKKKPIRKLAPGLLKAEDAAAYCAHSRSTWDRNTAAGLTPAPIRVGGLLAWSRRELHEWILRGCPDRATWQRLWPAIRDRRPARK